MKAPPRAFSLLELVVVIALIAVLTALAAPALLRVRSQGRIAGSLSNLRHHATVVAAYAGDFKESLPYLTDPIATASVIRCSSADMAVVVRYFEASTYWWVGLADQYYGGAWRSTLFRSPMAPPGVSVGSYEMACSFFADPRYFDQDRREDPPSQLRATRLAEVAFTSHKALFVDNSFMHDGVSSPDRFRARFQACTVDGRAARFHADRDMLEQYGTGDGPYIHLGAHWPWFTPMTHAVNGVHGRDVR